MIRHFNDLLMAAAHDGASAAISVCSTSSTSDVDQLMDAWYRERQERIEAGLLLEQACRVLSRIVSDGEITTANRRKATRLLLTMKAARKA